MWDPIKKYIILGKKYSLGILGIYVFTKGIG